MQSFTVTLLPGKILDKRIEDGVAAFGKGLYARHRGSGDYKRKPVCTKPVAAFLMDLGCKGVEKFLDEEWLTKAWIDRKGVLHFDGDPGSD